jgi:hypothetical protein
VTRSADPYRDLDVIDSRAPRTNQAVIGVLAVVAVATGWWWLLALLAAQLAIGLTFGRRFCLACFAYFELIQPRFGEGREDPRRARRTSSAGRAGCGVGRLRRARQAGRAGRSARGGEVSGFCTGSWRTPAPAKVGRR